MQSSTAAKTWILCISVTAVVAATLLLISAPPKQRLTAHFPLPTETFNLPLTEGNGNMTEATQVENVKHNISEKPVSKDECEQILGQEVHINRSNYRIQLIAAAPGSGSDWCRLSIHLLTGFPTEDSYNKPALKDAQSPSLVPLYYKTHYPFYAFPNIRGWQYINTHPERTVIVIRNPFDAAFSEYIREKLLHSGTAKGKKYGNMERIITKDTFILPNTTDEIQPEFIHYNAEYLTAWEKFHYYWLKEHSGPVKTILYSDLVRDPSKFSEIAEYFGYDVNLNPSRKRRVQCFLSNLEKTKTKKRPSSISVNAAKELMRRRYQNETRDALYRVEELYEQKYNRMITTL